MTEHTHAEHDPTRSTQANPIHPPSQSGVLYPEDDIVAVIADHSEAEQAVQALVAAGIPSDDINLLEGKQVLELEREFQERQTLSGRVAAFISFLMSDAGTYQQEYVDEATKGHHILVIHAPGRDVMEQARDILVSHHAQHARHYGSMPVEDLIP